MCDLSKVSTFIYTDKNPDDIQSVIGIFTGTNSLGRSLGSVNVVKNWQRQNWNSDYCMAIHAFEKCQEDEYVIICKDVVTTASTSEEVLNVVTEVINSKVAFDLFFMGKWLDRCDQYSDFHDVGQHGMKMVTTNSPNGVIALMFSPQGRRKMLSLFHPEKNPIISEPLGAVLNSKCSHEGSRNREDRFHAVTCTPNLLAFDITKSTGPNDIVKTHECRNPPASSPKKEKVEGNTGIFWFIVLIIITIVLIFALYKFRARSMGVSGLVVGITNTT
jgi:hypothetical protein